MIQVIKHKAFDVVQVLCFLYISSVMTYTTVILKGKMLNKTLTKLFKFRNQSNRVLTSKIVVNTMPEKDLMIVLQIRNRINRLMKYKLPLQSSNWILD